jgi:hypothetical protein
MSKSIYKNIGKIFNGVKLLKRSANSEKRVFADCECVHCGSIIKAELWNVLGGHYKSCGCLKHAFNTKSPRWKGFGEISLTHFNSIKYGAEKRNLEFNIKIEELWQLFLDQGKKCTLSGLDIRFPHSRIDYSSTASLDRINSKLGYYKDNVQWVHKDVNYAKQSMNNEEFLNLVKKIYYFNYE